MPYDKESFLAGVAVGRNLMGWPEMDGYGKNFFAFTIRVDSASFYYQFGIYFSGVVYWGDGTTEEPTPRYGRIYHTYADPGVYQIRIIGHFQSIMLGTSDGSTPATPSASAARLISVDTPYPQLTLQDGSYVSSVSLNWLFSSCLNLKQFPKNLFSNLKSQGVTITGLRSMFSGCSKLTKIPEKLFEGLVFATSFTSELSPKGMFYACTALTELPEDIFSNPGFENVTSVASMFSRCGSLLKLPHYMPFKRATDFTSFCSSCYALEEIPSGLFDLCESARYFEQAFGGCTSLREIPNGLFAACDLYDLDLCFIHCTSLTTIGVGAFTYHPNLTTLDAAFQSSGITEIPAGMFDGCTGITNVDSCFLNCSSLDTVALDLFSDSPNIDNFSYCFRYCEEITSAVPDFWARYSTARYHTGCFAGCVNALNYNSIPQAWGGPST